MSSEAILFANMIEFPGKSIDSDRDSILVKIVAKIVGAKTLISCQLIVEILSFQKIYILRNCCLLAGNFNCSQNI